MRGNLGKYVCTGRCALGRGLFTGTFQAFKPRRAGTCVTKRTSSSALNRRQMRPRELPRSLVENGNFNSGRPEGRSDLRGTVCRPPVDPDWKNGHPLTGSDSARADVGLTRGDDRPARGTKQQPRELLDILRPLCVFGRRGCGKPRIGTRARPLPFQLRDGPAATRRGIYSTTGQTGRPPPGPGPPDRP